MTQLTVKALIYGLYGTGDEAKNIAKIKTDCAILPKVHSLALVRGSFISTVRKQATKKELRTLLCNCRLTLHACFMTANIVSAGRLITIQEQELKSRSDVYL